MAKKKLHGVILSIINENTVVVDVENVKFHSRYKKRYKVNKKYLSHVDQVKVEKGQKVVIEESRPISKRKTWRVESVVEGAKN